MHTAVANLLIYSVINTLRIRFLPGGDALGVVNQQGLGIGGASAQVHCTATHPTVFCSSNTEHRDSLARFCWKKLEGRFQKIDWISYTPCALTVPEIGFYKPCGMLP